MKQVPTNEQVQSRVLLVDDEKPALSSLARVCVQRGFEVHEARSVNEALVLLQALAFDAAIVDLFLPDGLGFNVLRHARELDPGIALASLTGASEREMARIAFAAGAHIHARKADSIAPLLQALEDRIYAARHQPYILGRGPVRFRVDIPLLILPDKTQPLRPKEHALALQLGRARGRPVFRDALRRLALEQGDADLGDSTSVSSTAYTLNRHMGKKRRCIITQRGWYALLLDYGPWIPPAHASGTFLKACFSAEARRKFGKSE